MRRLLLLAALLPTTLSRGALDYCPITRDTKVIAAMNVDPKEAKCLAVTIYGEARGESEWGQVAVAWTAINRAVKHRICSVVLAPKQYSAFNNNRVLRAAAQSLILEPPQKNKIDNASWKMAVQIADSVLAKQVPDPTNGAQFYLSDKLMHLKHYHYPKWSREYTMVVQIDNHKFYKKGKA